MKRWLMLCFITGILIVELLLSGCSIFRSKPTIEIKPITPSEQMWETIKKANWTTNLAIPIIALGVVAVFNGVVKLGFSCVIYGCISLFMSLAASRYGLIMATCGLIGSIAACGVSILLKNKALIELIKGAQKLKSNVNNGVDGSKILSDEQNKRTQKLVQDIKSVLKLKKEI